MSNSKLEIIKMYYHDLEYWCRERKICNEMIESLTAEIDRLETELADREFERERI